MGPTALPLAFLLGLVSAIASACCTLPAMGVLVAYSGTRQDTNRRAALASAAWFLVGTTLALIILGFVAGLIGQTAQAFLGQYWKLFAGVVAVLFGLATLKMLPFKLPSRAHKESAASASGGKLGRYWAGCFLAACGGRFVALQSGHLHCHRRQHPDGARFWWGHGPHGRFRSRLQPAFGRHPVRRVVWQGVLQAAEGRCRHPDSGRCAVNLRRFVFASYFLMKSSLQAEKNSSPATGLAPDGVGHVGPEWTIGDHLGAIGVRLNIRRTRCA